MATKRATSAEETSTAWWLPRMLARHPPRIPPERGSPGQREPTGIPSGSCVAGASRITRFALEVIDEPLLYELLCLWTASGKPDVRHTFRLSASAQPVDRGISTSRTIAQENAALLLKKKRDAAAVESVRTRRNIEVDGPRWDSLDESSLAHETKRREALRGRQVASDDKPLVRARLMLLDKILGKQGAGWTRLDMADLIIASDRDWERPPIPGGVAKSLQDRSKMSVWIFEQLRADERTADRRR